ncbi:MAG: type II toxin-antitoxin system death-on-curing family toxin [Myxococcales bacterium]
MSELSVDSKIPDFLNVDEVLELHEEAIESFGGSAGVRDRGLLESAVAAPQAFFDGSFLHDGVLEMAAALAFHLCKNHPFVDGNKRTAFYAALAFMERNGYTTYNPAGGESLADVLVAVAEGRMGKEELVEVLRSMAEQRFDPDPGGR